MPPPPFGLIADQCASEGMVRAPELYQRLEQSRSERAVMIEAVEQFAVGTILLDAARSRSPPPKARSRQRLPTARPSGKPPDDRARRKIPSVRICTRSSPSSG
jgi:hypothetical protein